MKMISTTLLDHIQGEATTLTTCWEITRLDGTVVRLTELDVALEIPPIAVGSITIGGGRYTSVDGFDRTAVENKTGFEVDTAEINGLLNSSGISKEDVRASLYDGADLKIFMVNYRDLTQGALALKRGLLGEVTVSGSGRFQTELKSLKTVLQRRLVEKTSPTCRALLGDNRCKIPLSPDVIQRSTEYEVGQFVRVPVAPGTTSEIYGNLVYECVAAGETDASQPVYSTVVGDDTTDGTAMFKAHEAWTRHGSVISASDRRTLVLNVTEPRAVDDWFNQGQITFESGANAGLSMEVKDWDEATLTLTLFLPMPFDIGVGNVFTIHPGCDRIRGTCVSKFQMANSIEFSNGNIFNFRGEPDTPGRDFVLTYPDAQ
jgi:uncharacterized phage protein (TIGR02218 family)